MADLTPGPPAACRFALLVMGFTATAAQILLIRELLVVFHGNELSIGIILGTWLLLEAAGSYASRLAADRCRRPVFWFCLLQLVCGLGVAAALLLVRSFKYVMQISTGEILGLPFVFTVSLLALLLLAFPDGTLFPLGCRNLARLTGQEKAAGRVYLYQALGAFTAALTFVFSLIPYFSAVQLAMLILAGNCAGAGLYLKASGEAPSLGKASLVLSCLALLLVFSPVSTRLEERSLDLLWYDHDLVESTNSVYANLAVTREHNQYTFFVNGAPHAVTPRPLFAIEEKVHFSLLFQPRPARVLLIGGGPGGYIREIMKHPVKRLDYAEQDPLLIDCFRHYATPLSVEELGWGNLFVHEFEGRGYLRRTPLTYDLIMVNLPPPTTLLLNRYFTVEFFDLAASRLTPRGIFSLSLPGSDVLPSPQLVELNRIIHRSLKSVFSEVRLIVGDENIFLAANDDTLFREDAEGLIARLKSRGLGGGLVDEWYIRYKFDEDRFGPLTRDILAGEKGMVNRDLHPAGVMQSMLYLHAMASPLTAALLARLASIPGSLYACLVGAGVLFFLVVRRPAGGRDIDFVVATTGFTGMFMTCSLILAFQIYYGNIYQYIGLLTALFMMGLACGSGLGLGRGNSLLPLEVLIVCHALLVWVFFGATLGETGVGRPLLFLLCFFSGFLTGMEYPVAVRLLAESGKGGSGAAGRLYALDLAGALAAALFGPVLLIPALGMMPSLILVVALKAAATLLIAAGRGGKSKKWT